jgi:hypothetical protein
MVHDSKRGSKRIKWNEVNIDRDKLFISLFPISAMPSTPEGRLEYINNLVDTGKISNEDAIELLDMPDLESYLTKTLAVKQSIEAALDRMIESGVPERLDELDDPSTAYRISHLMFLEMKANNAPQQTLNVLRTYIADCESYLTEMQRQQAEQQAQIQQGAPADKTINVRQNIAQ